VLMKEVRCGRAIARTQLLWNVFNRWQSCAVSTQFLQLHPVLASVDGRGAGSLQQVKHGHEGDVPLELAFGIGHERERAGAEALADTQWVVGDLYNNNTVIDGH
jgi:hypothetical protein